MLTERGMGGHGKEGIKRETSPVQPQDSSLPEVSSSGTPTSPKALFAWLGVPRPQAADVHPTPEVIT